MTETTHLSIDIVSDVVCPWCYIGKKRLERAIAAVPELAVSMKWRPFQLDGTIPPEGLDRRQYMAEKFGSEERVRRAHATILPLGQAEGIAFDFDAIRVAPNTLDAHRLVRWAAGGGADLQGAVVTGLFRAYFEQGRDIGKADVLTEIAGEAGMDTAVVETLLATDSDRDAVMTEVETAARMGVTGVPCFLLESRFAVMGAQEPQALADALRQVAGAKARGELDSAG